MRESASGSAHTPGEAYGSQQLTYRGRKTFRTVDEDDDAVVFQEENEGHQDAGVMRVHRPLKTRINIYPTVLLVLYLAACGFYFYTRVTKTLVEGSLLWYSILIFAVECLGVTALFPYALLLVISSLPETTQGLPAAEKQKGSESYNFHVRVLVPCYKEDIEVVGATVRAALDADLPPGTRRTVYLCDDGKDAKKAAMCETLGEGCVYVTGRERQPNEINGKSNNLNNCLRNVIYNRYQDEKGEISWKIIPKTEVVVVFDADMVCKKHFFLRILEVMTDSNTALCLSPQAFHNINPRADLFNNINLQFWEYWLPGAAGWGYIACTGTNFCIRAAPLAHCGFFPTYTITEDYALGMELKMRGYSGSYLLEYLAVGEAPDEIRNVMRQRSRWTKGHMQVFFSWDHCPLLLGKLSLPMKFWYTYGTWSYFSTIVTVPIFLLVPFFSLTLGWNPVLINWWFALSGTLYYASIFLIQSYCRRLNHLKSLWFANISNTVLWFTYVKAVINVLLGTIGLKGGAGFKATEKKIPLGTVVAAPITRVVKAFSRAFSRRGSGVKEASADTGAPDDARSSLLGQTASSSSPRKKEPSGHGSAGLPPLASSVPVQVQGGGGASNPVSVTIHLQAPPTPEKSDEAHKDKRKKPRDPWGKRLKKVFVPHNIGDLGGVLDPVALVMMFIFCISGLGIGIWRLATQYGNSGRQNLLLSPYVTLPMLWAFYNSIPSYLFIHYCFTSGKTFKRAASFLQLLGNLATIAAVVLLWFSIPKEFKTKDIMQASASFLGRQEVRPAEWALLPDGQRVDVSGGWYPTGDAVKFVMPMASSMTVMALGLREFGKGYSAGERAEVERSLKGGADYLMKLFVNQNINSPVFIAQVGNPLDYYDENGEYLPSSETLPAFVLDKDHVGADLLGAAAAALAAASTVLRGDEYTTAAEQLYSFATLAKKGEEKSYCQFVPCKGSVTVTEEVLAVPVARAAKNVTCWAPDYMAKTCLAKSQTLECVRAGQKGPVFKTSGECCQELQRQGVWATLKTPLGVCALPERQRMCWVPDLALRTCLNQTVDPFTGSGCFNTEGGVFPSSLDCCNFLATKVPAEPNKTVCENVTWAGPPEPGRKLQQAALTEKIKTWFLEEEAGQPEVITINKTIEISFYDSHSVLDDLSWAAAWLYLATNRPNYLGDAQYYLQKHWEREAGAKGLASKSEYYVFDWNNQVWGSLFLLTKLTNQPNYHEKCRTFLRTWVELKPPKRDPRQVAAALAVSHNSRLNSMWLDPRVVVNSSSGVSQAYMRVDQCIPDVNSTRQAMGALRRTNLTSGSLQMDDPVAVDWEENCDDGIDNDCDGLVDDEDPDCEFRPVRMTPQGLAWTKGSPLPNAAQTALLSLMYSKSPRVHHQQRRSLQCWALGQVRYMLGDNRNHQSYVVGMGTHAPTRVQDRRSSCPPTEQGQAASPCSWRDAFYPGLDNPRLEMVKGSLVAGPDRQDQYVDERSHEDTRVGVYFTAGFTAALAGITDTNTDVRVCGQLQGLYQDLFGSPDL